jgi:hypothetical protein
MAHAIWARKGIYGVIWPFDFKSFRITVRPHIQHVSLEALPTVKRGNTKKINAYFCSMMSILNNQTCPVPVSSFSNHFRLAPHATQGQNQTHRC